MTLKERIELELVLYSAKLTEQMEDFSEDEVGDLSEEEFNEVASAAFKPLIAETVDKFVEIYEKEAGDEQ